MELQRKERWKTTAKNVLHRYAKVKSSKTTAASAECKTSGTTIERPDAKAATAMSFLVTSAPTQRESADPSTSAVSKGPTQQPHYEHGQELMPNEREKGELITDESTAPNVRGKQKEKQNDSYDSVSMGPSIGSMNEKLHSKESSGSNSDGGQLIASLKSVSRRRDPTALSSITIPFLKSFENVQPPSAENALENAQEADAKDKGPVRHVGHQVAELPGIGSSSGQGDRALSTEEATENDGVAFKIPSVTINSTITPDTSNAVRVGKLWVLPRPPLEYTRLKVYNDNIKPSVDWLLQCSKGSTEP
ncbi:hypothetical protein MMC17_007654 [Xylographa soralifera]|nr:hypothetical protein [Xylographa soralifera]